MQPRPECGLKSLQEPETGAQAAFEAYNAAAMHCELDTFDCVQGYVIDFVQHIAHVYHRDMSLPKTLVVSQFTIT